MPLHEGKDSQEDQTVNEWFCTDDHWAYSAAKGSKMWDGRS